MNSRGTTKLLLRKLAQAEAFLDLINDGCFILNEEWRFVYLNKAFERICNCSKSDFIGRNYWEIYPKATSLKFYTYYHKAMLERQKVQFIEYAPSLDKWVSIHAYPLEKGLIVYFTDITEERKLQEKIAVNEMNLRSLMNNTTDLIWSVDRQYRIISANNTFLGWARKFTDIEFSQGDYVLHTTFGEERIERWKRYYDAVFMGKTFTITEVFEHQGDNRYSEARLSPIYDPEQQIIGASCISRDITEAQKAFLIIQEQNERLREIAWRLSHQVRSQVATIMGLTQLFNPEEVHDPTNSVVLNGIDETARELDKIIRQINQQTSVL